MRAIVYARYSSENQRDPSIEDPVRLCGRRVDAAKWSVLGAYYIHGTSTIASGVQNELVAGLRAQFRNEQAETASKPKGRA